jgi:hypothetical protein
MPTNRVGEKAGKKRFRRGLGNLVQYKKNAAKKFCSPDAPDDVNPFPDANFMHLNNAKGNAKEMKSPPPQ